MIDHSKAQNMPLLPHTFFARGVDELAQALIGCYLFTTVDGERAGGMIIETEAYDQNDPFAHCHHGANTYSRHESSAMTFAPGNAYIYRSGQLHCLNFVCDRVDFGSAVLIRALLPTCNFKTMHDRRTEWYRHTGRQTPKCLSETLRERNLCNGPAVLSEALGIGEELYKQAKVGLSLSKPPFEIRREIEKLELISGIRIGLDAQRKRWIKEGRTPASAVEINDAAERKYRWGAKEYRSYCRYASFNQKWTHTL